MGVISVILLCILTLIFPPLGAFAVAGCGADLLINIIFTFLGWIPGHIHAFYLIYVYYDRKQQRHDGLLPRDRALGIFSEKVQSGGERV